MHRWRTCTASRRYTGPRLPVATVGDASRMSTPSASAIPLMIGYRYRRTCCVGVRDDVRLIDVSP